MLASRDDFCDNNHQHIWLESQTKFTNTITDTTINGEPRAKIAVFC